jgi:hypothetical protein
MIGPNISENGERGSSGRKRDWLSVSLSLRKNIKLILKDHENII